MNVVVKCDSQLTNCSYSQLKRARDWLIGLGQDVSSIDDALTFCTAYSSLHLDEDINWQGVKVLDDDSILSNGSINARIEQERAAASTQRFEGHLRLARGSAADLETMTRHRIDSDTPALQPSAPVQRTPTANAQPIHLAQVQCQDPRAVQKRKSERLTDNSEAPQLYHPPNTPSLRMTSREAMPPPPQVPAPRFTPHEFQRSQPTPIPIDFGSFTYPNVRPQNSYNSTESRDRNASQSPATFIGSNPTDFPTDFRTRDDGELDSNHNRIHHPSPQRRALFAANSISPARERLTLTPRLNVPSRGNGIGLLNHARSSSNLGLVTPSSSMGSHRRQLGQGESPFFNKRVSGSRMDPQIVNGLSFMEDPVIGSGRRRARR